MLLPSQVELFVFMLWNRKKIMLQNQENMEGDEPVQSHSHAHQLLQPQTRVQEDCECVQFSVSILSVRDVEEKVIMKGWHPHENYSRL